VKCGTFFQVGIFRDKWDNERCLFGYLLKENKMNVAFYNSGPLIEKFGKH
jgi:hypothetical protein